MTLEVAVALLRVSRNKPPFKFFIGKDSMLLVNKDASRIKSTVTRLLRKMGGVIRPSSDLPYCKSVTTDNELQSITGSLDISQHSHQASIANAQMLRGQINPKECCMETVLWFLWSLGILHISGPSASLRVQITQVTIPTQTDNVDDQHSVFQGHNAEVCCLNSRPYRPVGFQARNITLLKFFLWTLSLQDGHCRQENEHVCARKNDLIS